MRRAMTNTKAATDYLAASGATAIISDRPERR
jgi:hypothetical protein